MRQVSLKRGDSSWTILALKRREEALGPDWGNVLDKAQIEGILPHRDPFLLIDRVTELVPGEYAIAEKDVLATDDVFRGHFPGHPVFPGVLILEALAQTGAVAVLAEPEARGKIILFARADQVRFKRAVVPGDTLRLEMRLTKSRGPVGKGEAQAFVGSELACSGVLTFAVAER
jgi:3-hydroxyacyl-[acyl-carrier-protein] dehydratase